MRLAVLLGLISCSEAFKLYHRIQGIDNLSSFVERGTLEDDGQFTPSASFASDWEKLTATIHPNDVYQVALAPSGETPQDKWPISFVKACHLPAMTSEHFILHMAQLTSPKPFAFDYFTSPVPHNGACQPSSSAPRSSFNTTVAIRVAQMPSMPQLEKPPVVSPEGNIVKEEPEKTFLQKYWMYIAAFLVLQLLISAPSEEGQKK